MENGSCIFRPSRINLWYHMGPNWRYVPLSFSFLFFFSFIHDKALARSLRWHQTYYVNCVPQYYWGPFKPSFELMYSTVCSFLVLQVCHFWKLCYLDLLSFKILHYHLFYFHSFMSPHNFLAVKIKYWMNKF